jgi:hypothetical protein
MPTCWLTSTSVTDYRPARAIPERFDGRTWQSNLVQVREHARHRAQRLRDQRRVCMPKLAPAASNASRLLYSELIASVTSTGDAALSG